MVGFGFSEDSILTTKTQAVSRKRKAEGGKQTLFALSAQSSLNP